MTQAILTPFIQGFGTSGGLIAAIGAQNAFVLSQSVRGNRTLLIAAICIVCDAVFICMGVSGVGAAVTALPALTGWITAGGAAFLFCYGWKSFRSAANGGSLKAAGGRMLTLKATVLTTLAVTLLNPHFYLDTVVLIGSVSSSLHEISRSWFMAGAVAASTAWFISLSIGGKLLAPVLRSETAWRILDVMIGMVMWSIAASLILHQFYF